MKERLDRWAAWQENHRRVHILGSAGAVMAGTGTGHLIGADFFWVWWIMTGMAVLPAFLVFLMIRQMRIRKQELKIRLAEEAEAIRVYDEIIQRQLRIEAFRLGSEMIMRQRDDHSNN
jgi:hypothetical protein